MNNLPPFTLFLDLETTGSDEKKDLILEVGLVLCRTERFLPVVDEKSWVIRHGTPAEVLIQDPHVYDMHRQSGLLWDHQNAEMFIDEVEKDILNWLQGYVPRSQIVMAGSGVCHFDRRFLKAFMPDLDKRLVHYPLDVGPVRRFAALAGAHSPFPLGEDQKKHRGLSDAHFHRQEALMYMDILEKGSR